MVESFGHYMSDLVGIATGKYWKGLQGAIGTAEAVGLTEQSGGRGFFTL